MTLQASGQISMADINVELGNASSATLSIDGTSARTLAGKASGVISLSDFYGKSSTVTYTITVGASINSYSSVITSPINMHLMVYGGSKFVAMDVNGRVATSTNGALWTIQSAVVPIFSTTYGLSGAVVYASSKFVAVGVSASCYTSTDGVTWTSNTGLSSIWSTSYYGCGVAYGNSRFVAVGSTCNCATSTDGITWVNRTGLARVISGLPLGVVYSNSKFIVVTTARTAAYSTDGITWKACSTQFTAAFGTTATPNSFATSGSTCLVIGEAGSAKACAYCSTPTKWTSVSSIGGSSYTKLFYGNSRFVILSDNGYIYYSTNGSTWSTASTSSGLGAPPSSGCPACFGNGVYTVCYSSGSCFTSSDLVTWTRNSGLGELRTISYNNNAVFTARYLNSTFVVVGPDACYSTDGITWTASTGFYTACDYIYTATDVAYNNGTYVAIVNNATAIYSTTLSSWTISSSFRTTLGAYVPTSICYGDKFVVCAGTYAISSSDGITWGNKVSTTYAMSDVCYGGGLYVAVGASGRCVTSSDGITWNVNASFRTAFGTTGASSVCYGNGVFVAVGGSGTMAYSIDGITWTAVVAGTSGFASVAWTGEIFIATASTFSSYVYTSPDGVTWAASTTAKYYMDSLVWGVTFGISTDGYHAYPITYTSS